VSSSKRSGMLPVILFSSWTPMEAPCVIRGAQDSEVSSETLSVIGYLATVVTWSHYKHPRRTSSYLPWWNANIRKIIWETDSLTSIQMIQQGCSPFHPYASIISRIRFFVSCSWDLKFMHTYREVNVCADPLAKMGSLSNRHFVALEVCPASLICKVAVDAAGTIFLGL